MTRQRNHYDHATPIRLGVLRDRLFTAPDRRGNIPHLTRETADHESRRLNATMYETVGQMDAALDARLQPGAQTQPVRSSGGGWFGPVVLIGLGAALAWWLLSDDEDEVETARDVTPPSPPPTSPPTVVVQPPQHTITNITTPPPVPVVVPPPARRRRKRVAAPVAPVVPVITVETKVDSEKPAEEAKT